MIHAWTYERANIRVYGASAVATGISEVQQRAMGKDTDVARQGTQGDPTRSGSCTRGLLRHGPANMRPAHLPTGPTSEQCAAA